MTRLADRVLIIVPVEQVDAANLFASVIDPDTGGSQTFGAVALSPDGLEPRTHFLSSTTMERETVIAWSNGSFAQLLTDLATAKGMTISSEEMASLGGLMVVIQVILTQSSADDLTRDIETLPAGAIVTADGLEVDEKLGLLPLPLARIFPPEEE